MSEIAAFVPAAIGRSELRRVYNRNLTWGLVIATAIHFFFVGTYWGSIAMQREEVPTGPVRILKYTELGPPPSLTQQDVTPAIAISEAAVKPSVGIPVPVPDLMVNPDQTIATQQEMSAQPTPALEGFGTSTGPVIEQDVQLEAEDEEEYRFVPFEQAPVPIKEVKPAYPEIARMANLEGVVYINVLVDEEGKVKKALVAQSDAKVFEQPAIDAAMQFVFTPALQNKRPIKVWITIPFRFTITGSG